MKFNFSFFFSFWWIYGYIIFLLSVYGIYLFRKKRRDKAYTVFAIIAFILLVTFMDDILSKLFYQFVANWISIFSDLFLFSSYSFFYICGMNKIVLFIVRGIYKTTPPYKDMPDTLSKTSIYLHFVFYLVVAIVSLGLIINIFTRFLDQKLSFLFNYISIFLPCLKKEYVIHWIKYYFNFLIL